MLIGLMDHWVPSHDAISRFWKTPFATLKPHLERLCDEVAINNFTFYTKWYSNGIKSSLPFLYNAPANMNVVTDNGWGNELIDFFHHRGITVGAMLQCYTFDAGMLPAEAVLGTWGNLHRCTGYERDDDVVNPSWHGYLAVLEQMLTEQVTCFPGLDAVFLEFEGLGSVPAGNALWLLAHAGCELDIPPATRALWDATGFPTGDDPWIWAPAVQEMLQRTLCAHLGAADRALTQTGFTGTRGVVYHTMGYEVPYITASLPNRDWWLLPWHYWGWDFAADADNAVVRRQIDYCKAAWRALVESGHPVCYIGNATLPTERLDSVEELINFAREIGMAGYLGMGNLIPTYGLRWHGATEDSVARMRALYRRVLPR